MSSIDRKGSGHPPANQAGLAAQAEAEAEAKADALGLDPNGDPKELPSDSLRKKAAENGGLMGIAMLGMDATGLERVMKGEPANKFDGAAIITQQPPPLPPDAKPITAETQRAYQSMATDISRALKTGLGAQANQPSGSKALFATLATMDDNEAKTPQGEAKVHQAVMGALGSVSSEALSLTSSSMLAAFLILQVQNKHSGKELLGTLQDVMTKGRNDQIETQIKENEAASAASRKAAEKQKKMGVFAPLIEAIITVVAAIVSIASFGTMGPSMVLLAAMAIGFVAGGLAGGAKKGTGFDMSSAVTGMSIGAAVGTLGAKAIALVLEKLVTKAAERGILAGTLAGASKAVGEVSWKKTAEKFASNSSKAWAFTTVGTSAVGVVGTMASGTMNYMAAKQNIEAKEHMAQAKMAKVIAELLQNNFETLQTAISGIIQNHDQNVNQITSMLRNHNDAVKRTVSGIHG